MQDWKGKRVLITGASSGLGWAITEALAPQGLELGLLARSKDKMEELKAKLSHTQSRIHIYPTDVRDRLQVEKAIDTFARDMGGLDVAWVNSGIGMESSVKRWNWNEVEAMIQTNLMGAIYTTQACLKHMIAKGSGTIVGISSAAAMRGLPTRGIYSVTKVGLEYYLESMSCELPQIQFTTIYPGYVDTPINRGNPQRFWLMTADQAAVKMIRAVECGKRNYIYPFRMAMVFWAVKLLPSWLYRRLISLVLTKRRAP